MINKIVLIVFTGFLFFQNNPLYSQYEWRHRACPITFQGGGTSFVLGTKAYVVGGDTAPPSANNISAVVWEYDPTTDSWTQKNNFPHSANNPAWFVINDTAYVGLGLDSSLTYHTDFWRYDQANDQWVQISSFPGSPRYGTMNFTLNGIGYVGCGHGISENNDFYAYNPTTNSWNQMANFPGSARQNGFGASVGGKGYIGFGSGNGSYYADIYQYNDTLNLWTPINSFSSSGRYSPGSFVINDTLYVIGGQGATSFYQDCWFYNASGNSWSSQADFSCLTPDSVFIQDGFTINGHGYLRPLDASNPLHLLLEFGPRDLAFAQHINALGNDTGYIGNFTRVLSVPDSCALWSTGSIGPEITVSAYGSYWVRWNVSCGIAIDTIVISNYTKGGIETISDDNLITVYPNPSAYGLFNLKVDNSIIGNIVEIFDITGRVIYRDIIKDSQTAIKLAIESGIYNLRIAANNQLYVQKLIKL